MHLPAFDYYSPTSLENAVQIKNEFGGSAVILAGGTDLTVNLKNRVIAPSAVISLKNLGELKQIALVGDSLVIGAGASLSQVACNDNVRRHFPILVDAIKHIGAPSIQRHRGSIGGNLCLNPRCLFYNQSFFWRKGKGSCLRTGGKTCLALEKAESCQSICSGDTVPVIVALAGQLTIVGNGGSRSCSAQDFFSGKGETPFNLGPDEILTEIRIPIPWAPISSSYKRLSYRSAIDFPVINAACVATFEQEKIFRFRLVVSAAGPAPITLKDLESTFTGQEPSQELFLEAEQAAVRAVEGIVVDNSIASKQYRVKMAGVMARRATQLALTESRRRMNL